MFFSESQLIDSPSPARALGIDPARAPLPIEEFRWFLERERCLADRGTRHFALLVLHRHLGTRAGFLRMALKLRERLRSTDLVGHLAGDRLAVLLTDTGPEGVRAVTHWIDDAAASVGLALHRKTYIYPRVPRSEGRVERRRGASATRANKNGAGTNGASTNGTARERADGKSPALELAGVAAVAREPESMEDLWPRLSIPTPTWKRALDVVLSALALLALLPVFLVVAIAIRLDSPGPVFFSQLRAGRGGRPFAFHKFRSMFVDAEQQKVALQSLNEQVGPVFKIRKDPRITRVGRVLRRWSLDELPQLWNVLNGDFSLVGPRPPTLDELSKYERWQHRRLNVAGGITGSWQVSGRSEIGFLEWMRMDVRYIARRSLWRDLVLLARSIPAVLSGRGAY